MQYGFIIIKNGLKINFCGGKQEIQIKPVHGGLQSVLFGTDQDRPRTQKDPDARILLFNPRESGGASEGYIEELRARGLRLP